MDVFSNQFSPEYFKKTAANLSDSKKTELAELWPEECTEDMAYKSKPLNQLAKEIYEANKAKGFWPEEGRNVGECLMLMVTELAEGMEAHRKGLPDDHLPQYSGLTVELADCLIRILDFCGAHGVDIETIISEKLAYNAKRPHMHGKKY